MNRLIGVGNETGGRPVGANPGNEAFRLRGKPNELSDVGKAVLERIQSGKYKTTAKPYSRLIFRDEHARCLREGILFEDPEFPTNDSSIYYRAKPDVAVVWKRPGEVVPEPKLIAKGHSRFDVNQGKLGDCWLLAAMANLTLRDELFYRVVPPDQDFTKENYAGIFHFQFWRYGQWVDVVIDDRLPYFKFETVLVPYSVRSTDSNELWSALLEKAYVKIHKTYEHLQGGWINHALVDLTGGMTERHEVSMAKKDDIIKLLSKDLKNSFFGACFLQYPPGTYANDKHNLEVFGLEAYHAYGVNKLETLDTKDGQLILVRLHNPWGRSIFGKSREWKGEYSDSSPEWNNVPEDKRRTLQKERQDGEFWMHIDDFVAFFQYLEQCHLPLHELKEVELMTGVPQPRADLPVFEVAEHGFWSYKDRTTKKPCYPKCTDAPGCLLACPQYLLTVGSGAGAAGQQKELLTITLQQKYRQQGRDKGVGHLSLRISIYKAPKGTNSRVDQTFFQQNEATTKYDIYRLRELMMRLTLEPGDYIIVPFKEECYFDGEFFMRMFSNSHLQTRLLK